MTQAALNQEWLVERKNDGVLIGTAKHQVLYSGQTRWQHVQILRNPAVGSFLVLDNDMQSAGCDEFVYHEALVHPAMLTHPKPRKVAILGGAEGATLREVLRHRSVEKVTMVELDGELVELCRQHMPRFSQGAYEDPRTDLVLGDARGWLETCQEQYDVILSDLTEPGPDSLSNRLFSTECFRLVRERLSPDGVLAMQASCGCLGNLQTHCRISRTVATAFPLVRSMAAFVVGFNCVWAFLLATSGADPRDLDAATIDQRVAERIEGESRYYDGETHQRLLSLPLYMREELEQPGPVFRDPQ